MYELFNRISQKDSELNYGMAADTKEISIATKRDSSSMKVVALLTTIFLPGTFVSVRAPTRNDCILSLITRHRLFSLCHYSNGMHHA